VNVLVDTGASITIISSEKFYAIPRSRRPELIDKHLKVTLADDEDLATLGAFETDVLVDTARVNVTIFVAKIDEEGILGMDFFKKSDCQINLHEMKVTFGTGCATGSSERTTLKCCLEGDNLNIRTQ